MQTSLFQLYSAPDCQVKVEKVPTAGRLPGREIPQSQTMGQSDWNCLMGVLLAFALGVW